MILLKEPIPREVCFGSKAENLHWLAEMGFSVPETLLVEAMDSFYPDQEFYESLEASLNLFLEKKDFGYDIAIRSSCTMEDLEMSSMAGNFLTFLGTFTMKEIIERIHTIVKEMKAVVDGAQMGIILQRRIHSSFAGVAFSSNPLTYSKEETVISVYAGNGDELVSGRVAGEDITLKNGHLPSYESKISAKYLYFLYEEVKKIEAAVGMPVDVEWVVEACTGQLYLLQYRPMSHLMKLEDMVVPVVTKGLRNIPEQFLNHDKIRLRMMAEKNRLSISDAYFLFKNGVKSEWIDTSFIQKSEHCKGYSVVILYPPTIDGKVVRAFVGDDVEAVIHASAHPESVIENKPGYKSLEACIHDFMKRALKKYWVTGILIQEIFDPLYTGILKKTSEGYFIEIGKGHFIPKGMVAASRYIVKDGNVVYRKEVTQGIWYKIIEGHIVKGNDGEMIHVEDHCLFQLVDAFAPLLEEKSNIIEFGLLKEAGGLIPYLIDYIGTCETREVTVELLESGVISVGKILGRLVPLALEDVKDAINHHFHDHAIENSFHDTEENLIFLCNTPDISLLSLLGVMNENQIGFVFRQGSVLCHLAILLRERGIPAIILEHAELCPGAFYELDATSMLNCAEDRIKKYC